MAKSKFDDEPLDLVCEWLLRNTRHGDICNFHTGDIKAGIYFDQNSNYIAILIDGFVCSLTQTLKFIHRYSSLVYLLNNLYYADLSTY